MPEGVANLADSESGVELFSNELHDSIASQLIGSGLLLAPRHLSGSSRDLIHRPNLAVSPGGGLHRVHKPSPQPFGPMPLSPM